MLLSPLPPPCPPPLAIALPERLAPTRVTSMTGPSSEPRFRLMALSLDPTPTHTALTARCEARFRVWQCPYARIVDTVASVAGVTRSLAWVPRFRLDRLVVEGATTT